MHKQDVDEATGRDVSSLRVCRPAGLETWAMSRSTFTVLRNAFHAFVRALNFKTMWDCERTTELLDRVGIPDLETMEQPRNAIDRQLNVGRMHPGRLPQQVLYGWMRRTRRTLTNRTRAKRRITRQ